MYKRILIVVGDRDADRAALKEGLALAKVHASEVLLYYVLPTYTVTAMDMPPLALVGPVEFERAVKSNAQRALASARLLAEKAGVRCRDALGTGIDPAKTIAAAARKKACGLIVVGTQGRNALTRLLTGSVVPGLITHSSVPVLICRKSPASTQVARQVVPLRPRRARASLTPVRQPARAARPARAA
ncbi:MAG: universal stress protein [Burkholderiaceae bacterium]